jgi:putative PIN family toxin of toxin-antitoxin system
MLRVIVDTSVAVSAGLRPDGVSNKAFLFALFHCQSLISPDTFSELESVLNKTKFANRLSDKTKTQVLATVLARSIMIKPVSRLRVCRDVNPDCSYPLRSSCF